MKKPELLAPAGSFEALKAAVLAGCDAVYLGGKFFGARSYASNFSDEEMVEAIKYCHLYGVKVYVTMNTLVYEKETKAFIEYALFLHKNNVDAIIIQDIGMMDYLRKKYPNLKLHASTQMHIHNVEGVKLMEDLGLERCVVARETPLSLIKEMKKNKIELEVFVQGALCISYSGQCLMSSLSLSRSGNRGTCSQCCRMPYALISEGKKVNKTKYLLSPKDLNSLNYLKDLIECGVDSFKIEGRMKRKEYVYVVVSLYRKAIDSYFEKGYIDISEKEIEELKKIFNRGFTKGFLNNELSEDLIHSIRPNHMGIEIGKVLSYEKGMVKVKLNKDLNQNDGIRILDNEDPGCIINKLYKNGKLVSHASSGDIVLFPIKSKVNSDSLVLLTTDSIQLKQIDEELKKDKKIKIEGNLICRKNENLLLEITDGKNIVTVKGEVVEASKKIVTDKERIISQINKTGNTCFEFEKLNASVDCDIFVNIKLLNDIRREALEKLKNKRYYEIKVIEKDYSIDIKAYKTSPKKIAYIKSLDDYLKGGYDEYITDDIDLYNKIDNKLLKLERVKESLEDHDENLLVGELGSVYKYKNVNTDFSLNVVNSYSVAFLHSLNVNRVCLSYEMNDFQINSLLEAYQDRYHKKPNIEVIVSSIPEVMILKYDLLKTNKVSLNEAILKDTFNHEYKVVKKNNLTHIYFYKRLEKEKPDNYLEKGISIRYHY